VTTSSAPKNYSTILSDINPVEYKWTGTGATLNTGIIAQDASDVYTSIVNAGGISGTTGSITISNGGSSYYTVGATGSSSTFTVGAGSTFSTFYREEFVTCMPEFNRIQAMCKEYPGLQIAFEKFKTTYNMVKDDYDSLKGKK
jgi:hypothetical protein